MRSQPGWFTRERLSTISLLAATLVAVWLCYRLIQPFVPALAWALSFAVISRPLHKWLELRMKPALAAFLTSAVVAVALAGPAVLVTREIVKEAARGAEVLKEETEDGKWRQKLRSNAVMRPIVDFLDSNLDLKSQLDRASGALASGAKAVLAGSFSAGLQLTIALFVLFFMLRDRRDALSRLRSLLPMTRDESDELITRVGDAVYGTVFGHLAVAFIQGALGGIIFALLGLPAPVVWGAVMFVMAIIPVLGAFAVWGPVVVYLALTGSWGKAAILAAFGSVVISLIDNLLYPVLVGKKLRLHTVPVFFSLVGGLALLGASGIVIGPIILAVTTALLDLWCSRTSNGRTGEARRAS